MNTTAFFGATSTFEIAGVASMAVGFVIIRTVLSFSLQIEIDGVVPWKRALTTGPQMVSRALKTGADSSQ